MANGLVEMFEHWAAEARAGRVLFAGIAAALIDDQIAVHHEGHRGFETNCREAVKCLDQELDNLMAPRRLGDRDFSLDASHVEYPLVSGISWDFLTWLVDAEMRRRRLGALPPLRVAFTMPQEIDPTRVSFFNNVCRPLLPLIGAVEDVNAEGGRYNPFITRIGIVVAARGGEQVPKLAASDEARKTMAAWLHGTKPIVITLREVGYFSKRNSNMAAWGKFAEDLKAAGEEVIFVRDTAKATQAVPGFATCPQASYDVQYRMALYEHAKLNFCVGNGPGELLIFSNIPYCYFVGSMDDDHDANYWLMNHGLSEGEQMPWATPQQRLFWQSDSYENITEAWGKVNAERDLCQNGKHS